MKGFPFKRHLIVLGVVVLLIGIMVPLASFAKQSPPGERPRSISASLAAQSAAPGKPISITTDCSSTTLQTIATFSKGDQVQGTAMLTSGDPNEASENENLHLQEQNSQFTKPITTVTINNSPQNFFFVAGTFHDTLTACVDGLDDDDIPTVIVTITRFPQLDTVDTISCKSAELKDGKEAETEKFDCSLDTTFTLPDKVVGCATEIGVVALQDLALAAGHPELVPLIELLGRVNTLREFVTVKTNLERAVKLVGFVLPAECITGLADLVTHGQFSALGRCLADTGCTKLLEQELLLHQR